MRRREKQIFILYCPYCDEITWFSEDDLVKYEISCPCGKRKEILLGAFIE